MSKKVKIILMMSLLLNLVSAGFIGVHTVRMISMHMDMNNPNTGLDTVIMQLPAEKAQMFVGTVKELENGRKAMFKNMKETRDAVRKAMLAEPFDADAVRKAFDKMETPRKNATEKIISLAEKLNADERKLLVDYFEKNVLRGPMMKAFKHMKRQPGPEMKDDMPPPHPGEDMPAPEENP